MADCKETVCRKKCVDLKSLKKYITKKKQNVEKLQKEYNSLKSKKSSESNKSPENLKSSFLMLKAKIEVLNSSIPLNVPNSQPLLFAYVHHSLRKEVTNLEELISFQKQMLCISLEKHRELKELCEREQIGYNSTDVLLYQRKTLENESTRSEMLKCLHKKLASRIRRIARQFYPSVHIEIENKKNTAHLFKKEKSMLYILEQFVPELSQKLMKCKDWEKPIYIRIDESFPKNYIQLLLDYRIVEPYEKNPLCLKLITRCC